MQERDMGVRCWTFLKTGVRQWNCGGLNMVNPGPLPIMRETNAYPSKSFRLCLRKTAKRASSGFPGQTSCKIPFDFFSQRFFIQPLVRTLFRRLFADKPADAPAQSTV